LCVAIPLETYAWLESPKAIPEALLRRIIRGVSTRDFANVIGLTRDRYGVQKLSPAANSSGFVPLELPSTLKLSFHSVNYVAVLRLAPLLPLAISTKTSGCASSIDPESVRR
jgi:hypothetical protein